MRRDLMRPPRTVGPELSLLGPAGAGALDVPGTEPEPALPEWPAYAAPASSGPPPARDRLADPSRAHDRRRHLFDPQRGWVRGAERAASLFLARHVYPRIPGLALPYDGVLRRSLTLTEADLALPDLPAPFEGLRVLLITDPHAGPFVSPAALLQAMRRLQSVEPDLILVGGDLTTSRLAEFESHREAFAALAAPLGVYAVLGNHDHYTGETPELRRKVEALGIRMLHNSSVQLERDGARLSLAGVDDLLRGEPDLDAALHGTRGPVILLSHNPDMLFAAARRGVALMLSGHTHAGQIRIPGLPVIVRQSRYRLDEGRFLSGPTELVVSRGLGAVGLPWRSWCPPEGVLLRLQRRGN